MATMNVSLPDQMKDWVESRAAHGRFSNSSDYVRSLIRQDQEREAAIGELQALVDEGLEGEPDVFDMERFLSEKSAARAP
ncbi:MAG: type II toxin-antitoxin system ParD family antitoxin [Pseudomonadota bacterium]